MPSHWNVSNTLTLKRKPMCKSEIVQGGEYFAKIGHVLRPVRVDEIRLVFPRQIEYHVTNLRNGRSTVLYSHHKFRGPCVNYLERQFGHSQIISQLRASFAAA